MWLNKRLTKVEKALQTEETKVNVEEIAQKIEKVNVNDSEQLHTRIQNLETLISDGGHVYERLREHDKKIE